MQRICDRCGTSFEAQRVTAKFCSAACRKRNQRSTNISNSKPPKKSKSRNHNEIISVLAAVEEELKAADALDSSLGLSAVALARLMDAATIAMGSAAASISRELRATMDQITSGKESKGDMVDELRSKREKRTRKTS